jgi:hypothetical protein
LHGQKPVVSRLPDFLAQLTPTSATISNLDTDFTTNTLTITGNAPSLDLVNVFTDGLKFTKYQMADGDSKQKAFSNVVLTSFSRDSSGSSYTITLNYDPAIFSNDNDVTLVVPNITSTRSVIEQPGALFKGEQ